MLQATPERRRAALWRSAERFTGAKFLRGEPITDVWQLEILGFSPELQREDFDWLLANAEQRSASNERQIAANAALRLWVKDGARSDQLARIELIGGVHPEVAAAIANWTRPPSPSEKQLA